MAPRPPDDGPLSLEPQEQQLVEHLVEGISASLDPRQPDAPDDAAQREIARAALPFLLCRREGEILVRVWNPAGAREGRTVVEVLMRDQPFLVDTLKLNLRRLGLRELLLWHPLLAIERQSDGGVARVGKRVEAPDLESYMYAEVSPVASGAERTSIAQQLERLLAEVAAVVADHPQMVERLREHTADIEFAAGIIEGGVERARKLRSFLDWLAADNFIFLGYRRYEIDRRGDDWVLSSEPQPGLGMMRNEARARFADMWPGAVVPPFIRSRLAEGKLVYFDKSRSESVIHRSGRMDSISIKILDAQGGVCGFGRFIGLLTHKAVRTRGSEIPLLRERLPRVLRKVGAAPESFTYKAAIVAYDSLPVEFLFPFDVETVAHAVKRILRAGEQLAIEVFVVPDARNQAFFVSVILPRANYDETLCADLEAILTKHFKATYVDHRSCFLDEDMALIHFFCSSVEEVDLDTLAGVERDLVGRVELWGERFEAALLERTPRATADRLAREYAPVLPSEYRLVTTPAAAVLDVTCLERIRSGECGVDFGLSREPEALRLKVYLGERPYLTDLLPVLDDFGLRVIDATLIEVRPEAERPLWIVTFRIEDFDEEFEIEVLEGLQATLEGSVESDALNGLILGASLEWQRLDLLRAYLAYAEQLGAGPDRAFAAETLLRYPAATRALVDRFDARFAPRHEAAREEAELAARAALEREREPIPTFAEDRVFGWLSVLIDATLRTSFYRAREPGTHEIAFKLDPAGVEGMPSPVPFAEIFVHSREMIGVHLRGGPVARGGVRWSDRVHGFRNEILGLMKTQMVKNGLIVPVGSKGGFVLRRRFSDPAEARVEADRQYQRFIRALLRLTDNVGPDGGVEPAAVVRHDGDDPYLVVAADKGTAHLSDTANRIADEEGFWLADAFASGGTNGYDHRKQGITARGAWVSVQRHFLEFGADVDDEPFTVVGIGDMSGDVFGNGMLLARQAKLIGAFNHEHIFLDPEPLVERARQERKRLFELPGSAWCNYDPETLSRGGGVFPRDAKSIPLSPEARAVLGVVDESLSGVELIRALLRAPVDLLWIGGIGTYVKAASESDADVGDRANASARVNAAELRARVVGEGGNLGFTQLARVEYARRGGLINTDAVDNSGGVDLSDQEVNFKVLLASAVASGRVTKRESNALLQGCVETACQAVLAHSAAQSRCLAMDRLRAEEDPERMVQAAAFLARHAGLDWRLEFLPEREELRARMRPEALVAGYTRPELAILLGYTKMLVKRELVASDLIDHPTLLPVRLGYFPEGLVERFGDEIEAHRLRREITATCLANQVIDQAGVTLVPELVKATGARVADVVFAFYTVARLLEADHLRWAVARLPLGEPAKLRVTRTLNDAVRAGVRSRLGAGRSALLAPEEAARWTAGVRSLRRILPESLGAREREHIARAAEQLEAEGIGAELAVEVSRLPALVRALGVVALVIDSGASLPRAAAVHTRVAEDAGIAWLLDRLGSGAGRDVWDRVAAEALYLDVLDVQRRLTESILRSPGEDSLSALPGVDGAALRQIDETIREIEADERGGLAALTVLARQILRLC